MRLGARAVNVSGTVIDNGLDSVGLEALADFNSGGGPGNTDFLSAWYSRYAKARAADVVNRGPPRFDTRSNQRAHSNRGPPPVNGVRRVTRILGPSRVDRALSKLRFSLVCDGGCVANDSLNERHRFYLLSQRQSQTRVRGRGTGIPNKSLLTSAAGPSVCFTTRAKVLLTIRSCR